MHQRKIVQKHATLRDITPHVDSLVPTPLQNSVGSLFGCSCVFASEKSQTLPLNSESSSLRVTSMCQVKFCFAKLANILLTAST